MQVIFAQALGCLQWCGRHVIPSLSYEEKRIRWLCRRGMRELDLVFSRFLDQHFTDLEPPERVTFERLLNENDQDIMSWLTGNSLSEDPAIDKLIVKLRDVIPNQAKRRSNRPNTRDLDA